MTIIKQRRIKKSAIKTKKLFLEVPRINIEIKYAINMCTTIIIRDLNIGYSKTINSQLVTHISSPMDSSFQPVETLELKGYFTIVW